MENIRPEQLAAQNPQIDAGKLKQNLELIEKLKKAGVVKKSGYNLAKPYSRKAIVAG